MTACSLLFLLWILGAALPAAGAAADTLGASARQPGPGLVGSTAELAQWLSRRRQFTWRGVPYGLTGLPIAYFTRTSGWNYGGRLKLTDYRRRPFRYKLILNWVQSENDRHDYFFRLQVPRIAGIGWGLRLQLDYTRGLRQYYGLGNDTYFDKRFVKPGHPLYRDEQYYLYSLRKPRLLFSLVRELRGPLKLALGFGLKHVEIAQPGTSSLLFEQQPHGLQGGLSGLAGLMLRWDSRDDEFIPRRGVLHEWSYEISRDVSLADFLLFATDFRRYTLTDLRFFSLGRRAILANRAVFELLHGQVPIDVYGDLGSIRRRVAGLGGDESLRGFNTQRFIDHVRFFSNTELRCALHRHRLLKQYLEWNAIAFADLGRVWPNLAAMTARGTRMTGGVGLRLYWDEDFAVNAEVRLSAEREENLIDISLGNIF
jgi:outer membrane protein assembly factor BamA